MSTIREEGEEEEEEFPLKAVSHPGLEEEEEGEDQAFGEGEEEYKGDKQRTSVTESMLDDIVSRDVEVKGDNNNFCFFIVTRVRAMFFFTEVGIQNRYTAVHSQTDVSGDFIQGPDELYARPRDKSESYISLSELSYVWNEVHLIHIFF